MLTFVTETYDDGKTVDLCVINDKQEVTKLATFVDRPAVGKFWETYNLGRKASHEHGRSGI